MASTLNEYWVVKCYDEGEFEGYVRPDNWDLTKNEDYATLDSFEEAKKLQEEASDTYPDCMLVVEELYI